MAYVDTSELRRWERALTRAGRTVHTKAPKVVAKGAVQIKAQARATAPVTPHAPLYALSINYDLVDENGVTEATIGPEPGRKQWGLGAIFEYGTPRTKPRPHLEPALDSEEPRFYNACGDLSEQLIVDAWEGR